MRDIITLACTDCKRRNYSTTKNKKKTTERLELSKYCRFCRKHTGSSREQVDESGCKAWRRLALGTSRCHASAAQHLANPQVGT